MTHFRKSVHKSYFVLQLMSSLFEEKSDLKLYVGKVVEVLSPTTFKIKFLHRNFRHGRSLHFPAIDHIANVSVNDIVHKVSLSVNIQGTVRQQGHFMF